MALSTVKRYWPEYPERKPVSPVGGPALKPNEKLIRDYMKQCAGSKTPALHAAQLIQANGRKVPTSLRGLAEAELKNIYHSEA